MSKKRKKKRGAPRAETLKYRDHPGLTVEQNKAAERGVQRAARMLSSGDKNALIEASATFALLLGYATGQGTRERLEMIYFVNDYANRIDYVDVPDSDGFQSPGGDA